MGVRNTLEDIWEYGKDVVYYTMTMTYKEKLSLWVLSVGTKEVSEGKLHRRCQFFEYATVEWRKWHIIKTTSCLGMKAPEMKSVQHSSIRLCRVIVADKSRG